ncbi:dienelactone hydrolase family protein [Roseomonas sp. AR75]|uniref:dienelactone hydrolase family protein n=1 Tax=Roseomonas sp. AR75 TaxID=2562311 RepID=UPI001F0D7466|nr:dienelactone hydrolase family protein [Roseomonas sp. AR75]
MTMQELPARIELHPVQTLTLTDAQFLRGEADGAPTTLAVMLSFAQGGGRQPCVLLMHGSGGNGPSIPLWVRQINAMGSAACVLDGFSGRGLASVSQDQARLGRLAFCLDIYRALALLAAHPLLDPARIAVLGFSRGGQGALYAAMARFHRMWNADGPRPVGTLAFYPDCATRYLEDTAMIPGPIRVFHGTPDDMNPLSRAREHVERLAAAGHDAALLEYPGGHHGFDNPLSGAAARGPAQSVRDCRIEEREPGLLVNAATGAPFTYDDPCVARVAHVGGNAEAGAAARRDALDFLRGLLALG